MNKARNVTKVGICVAMLIGAQLALGGVWGIEIVSVLLLSFSFVLGISASLAIATTFSLLRCLIFGSYINVIILYLIYYNLFALYFACLGKRFAFKMREKQLIITIVSAIIFTACFTLLDDIITPLFYGFTKSAAIAYFYASLYTMLTQTICVGISVAILFPPLTLILLKIQHFKN